MQKYEKSQVPRKSELYIRVSGFFLSLTLIIMSDTILKKDK